MSRSLARRVSHTRHALPGLLALAAAAGLPCAAIAQPRCAELSLYPTTQTGDTSWHWFVDIGNDDTWFYGPNRRITLGEAGRDTVEFVATRTFLDADDDRRQYAWINWNSASDDATSAQVFYEEKRPMRYCSARETLSCGSGSVHPESNTSSDLSYFSRPEVLGLASVLARDAAIFRIQNVVCTGVPGGCGIQNDNHRNCYICFRGSVPAALGVRFGMLNSDSAVTFSSDSPSAGIPIADTTLLPDGKFVIYAGSNPGAPAAASNITGFACPPRLPQPEYASLGSYWSLVAWPMTSGAPMVDRVRTGPEDPNWQYRLFRPDGPLALTPPPAGVADAGVSVNVLAYGTPGPSDYVTGTKLAFVPGNDNIVYRYVAPPEATGPIEPVAVPSMGSTRPRFASMDGKFVVGERATDWNNPATYQVWVWTSATGSSSLEDFLTSEYNVQLAPGTTYETVHAMDPVGPINSYARARAMAHNFNDPGSPIPVPPVAIGADVIVVRGNVNGQKRLMKWHLTRVSNTASELTNTYDNNPGGDWNNPDNWSRGVEVNDVYATAIFNVPGSYSVNINNTKNAALADIEAGDVTWIATPANTQSNPGVRCTASLEAQLTTADCAPPYSLVVARQNGSIASLTLQGTEPMPTVRDATGLVGPSSLSGLMSIQTPYGIKIATGANSSGALTVGSGARLGTTILGNGQGTFLLDQQLGSTPEGGDAVGAISVAAGANSNGALTVAPGGGLIAFGLSVATGPTSSASLHVGGSLIAGYGESALTNWCPTLGFINLGLRGNATMTVANDALVKTGGLRMGILPGSSGTLTLDGPSQRVIVNAPADGTYRSISVGEKGSGTLTVSNGATVEFTLPQSGLAGFVAASQAGGSATVNIDRSLLQVGVEGIDGFAGTVNLGGGESSTTDLTVRNGGSMNTVLQMRAFDGAASTGTITLIGRDPETLAPSTIAFDQRNTDFPGFDNEGGINIGAGGNGVFRLINGGRLLNPGAIRLGPAAPLVDMVAGAITTPGPILIRGSNNNGVDRATLNVSSNSTVTCASLAVEDGRLIVSGTGSLVTVNGDLLVSSDNEALPSVVEVSNGGRIVTQTLSVRPNTTVSSQITVGTQGGFVPPPGIQTNVLLLDENSSLNPSNVTFLSDGGIGGTGTWPGSFTNQSSMLPGYVVGGDPDFVLPQPLRIAGNFTQTPDAALNVRLEAASGILRASPVSIAGTATLAGNIIVTDLVGVLSEAAGEAVVLTAAGGLSGTFAQIIGPPLPGGKTWGLVYDDFRNEVRIVIVPPCPADFNQDGGVDGDDVISFFSLWDLGDAAADFNRDEGVDGDDVIGFFTRWDSGC